jgi:poly-gamma-glutamate synthesis protein (capsule biosynthesis protein)
MLRLGPIAVLLAVAACGPATHEAAGQPSPSGPGESAPTASPSASAPSSPPATITLAFAGDVHFTGRTAGLLAHPDSAFGPISAVLSSTDLTMVNLETAVTDRGTPQPKTFHFRAPASAFAALRAAGIDLVTVANNHVLDYGQVGLADTLAAAKAADFPLVGAGTDASQAWMPWYTTLGGRRIAILGMSQVNDLASSWVATPTRPGEAHVIDLARSLDAVRQAKQHADVVIVFMHWGTEGQACPNAAQRDLAPKLAAAGADIIIGAHAHILQGSGWLGHTFVAYGMANFLWYSISHSTATGVLVLTLPASGPLTSKFVPAVVSATGQPIPLSGAAAAKAGADYAALRSCTGLSASPPP